MFRSHDEEADEQDDARLQECSPGRNSSRSAGLRSSHERASEMNETRPPAQTPARLSARPSARVGQATAHLMQTRPRVARRNASQSNVSGGGREQAGGRATGEKLAKNKQSRGGARVRRALANGPAIERDKLARARRLITTSLAASWATQSRARSRLASSSSSRRVELAKRFLIAPAERAHCSRIWRASYVSRGRHWRRPRKRRCARNSLGGSGAFALALASSSSR